MENSSSVVVNNKALFRDNLLDHEWTFITVYPFAPRSLRRKDPFQQ
jgi:hypothetical protein